MFLHSNCWQEIYLTNLLKEAYFYPVKSCAIRKMVDGYGIMRLLVSQKLIIQSEGYGCEGDCEVSSVSGGARQQKEHGWESTSARVPHRPCPGRGLG